MSEIEDIADTEFNKLVEHVDLGELDVSEPRTHGWDMSEDLLDVVLGPVDDMLSIYVGDGALMIGDVGNCAQGLTNCLKAGATQEDLADEYRIECSTVGDTKKNEDEIRLFALTMESMAISKKGQKVMHLADVDKLDEAVYFWFVQKRIQDIPIGGPSFVRKFHSFIRCFAKAIQSLLFSCSFIYIYMVLYYMC